MKVRILKSIITWSVMRISERFRQFCFFTKRSTLLLENSRKINLHLFFIEQHAKFFLFLLMLVDQVKSKKRYLFREKRRVFKAFEWNYFDVNIVHFSCISHFTKQNFKARKRYLFSVWSNLFKSAKKVPFCSQKRSYQKSKKGTFLRLEAKFS